MQCYICRQGKRVATEDGRPLYVNRGRCPNGSQIVLPASLTHHLPIDDTNDAMRGRRRYHEPRRYVSAARYPRRRSASVSSYLVTAGLIGAVAWGGWVMTDPDRHQAFISNAKEVAIDVGMMRERPPQEGDYWRGCDDARAAGTAPIYRGEPGYREGMDGDNDGIACEPYR